jgi:hypothetical protein
MRFGRRMGGLLGRGRRKGERVDRKDVQRNETSIWIDPVLRRLILGGASLSTRQLDSFGSSRPINSSTRLINSSRLINANEALFAMSAYYALLRSLTSPVKSKHDIIVSKHSIQGSPLSNTGITCICQHPSRQTQTKTHRYAHQHRHIENVALDMPPNHTIHHAVLRTKSLHRVLALVH